jgi:hypothetical protein
MKQLTPQKFALALAAPLAAAIVSIVVSSLAVLIKRCGNLVPKVDLSWRS